MRPNRCGDGRQEPVCDRLEGEERAELEQRVACYTRPFKEVQRAKMILYAAEGLTNREIAARLDTAPDVVGRWRKRFHEQRSGRSWSIEHARAVRAVFPPEEVAQVKAIACELPREHGRAALALLAR